MSFFRELKRRNVFRAGIAYLAIAWLLLQVADTLVPALRLPDWFITAVAVLLILGFPVALVLAWAYELTPDGVRREVHTPPSARPKADSGRRLDFVIIGVLVVALGYFVWESRIQPSATPATLQSQSTPDRATGEPVRIAVLPFANTSPDPDQEYFSDGVTEEILNRLSRIDELAVTSRTSAFAFKNENVPIPEIARVLGVGHVLEGSVRKSGDRVRISAQLIRVDEDRNLWSEVYERDLTDIFELQDDISANIAAALHVNLLGGAAGESDSRLVNSEAYDLYLHGLDVKATQTLDANSRSTELFEKSLAIDPLFVPARAALAWNLVMRVTNGLVSREEYEPKIREHVELGLQMDPDNAGLIGVTAQLAYIDDNFEKAERLYRQALDSPPPHYNAEFWYPLVLQISGKLDLARQFVRETLENDPLNVNSGLILAHLHSENGDFDAFFDLISRLEIIAPGNPYPIFNEGYVKIVYLGDLVDGIADVERAATIDIQDHDLFAMLAILFADLGFPDRAEGLVDEAIERAPNATIVLAAQAYLLAYEGDVQAAREISLRALAEHEHFDRWWGGFLTMRLAVDALLERGEAGKAAEMILEAEPRWAAYRDESPQQSPHLSDNPGYYNSGAVRQTSYLPDFARALTAAGDDEGARNVLAHHERMIRWRRENGLIVWETNAAELHALRGEADQALEALEAAVNSGTIYVYVGHSLFRNRIFDGIRDRPEFRDVLQRVEAELTRQRALLESQRSQL